MKAIAMFLGALAISTAAIASDTARVDGRLVTTGMTVGRRRESRTSPTSTARWEYHRGRKMVTLWVQTGKA